ncbi:hypothetical protein ED733_001232 [Metarhizium rileyi]|uniref:UBA domain-containing protein n=1 Tax=Metarhizium rileyi (strain RCEF 4871) TaxID=1649241 RepID=A0A5C6G5K8_METRR|nr:hypothetical protein ED733_001232 [Metarhizium rileyi]
MTSTLSKRQQARNEKALQDLVHKVAGNNYCADCHARSPGSFNATHAFYLVNMVTDAKGARSLGIMECTHVSKVKSLSMDSWSNEQVDNMRKVGNVSSNQIYNLEGRKPPVPIDADEVDSAMERFIRQKYIHNVAAESNKPRSRGSDEGTPPPLPPKNSTKFGFKSASTYFPLSSRAKKEHRAVSGLSGDTLASSTLPNKPSKLFGAAVGYDGPDDMDKNLANLYEMGFQDTQRNAIVLKGVNGNIDRAIEALVRLGEGRSRSPAPAPAPAPAAREPTLRATKSMTPLRSTSATAELGLNLNVPQKLLFDGSTTSPTSSTNPFDMMPPAQPQTAQSTGTLHNKNTYNGTNNPFGPPPQQVDLSQALEGLHVSTSHPTFFPRPNVAHLLQPSQQQQQQQQPYQQYMSPSAPASPQSYQSMNFHSSMTYPQPILPAQQSMQNGYNSGFSQPSSPSGSLQHLTVNTAQGSFANNPFLRSPTRIASPSLGQIPEQAQSHFIQSPFLCASPQPVPMSANPFFTGMYQPQQQVQQFAQQTYAVQQPQQLYQQQPRHDRASIMALFNQPSQNAPQHAATDPNITTSTPSIPENKAIYTQSIQPLAATDQQPRNTSQLVPGHTNPYLRQAMAQPDPFASSKQISRESMKLGLDMAWTNGRHSPDAFASLSARHV